MALPYRIIQSELEKGNCWSVLNRIYRLWKSPPDATPLPPLVTQLFHCSSEEMLENHEVEQLTSHSLFHLPHFTFSPGSLLHHYRLSAPGCQQNLFALCASHGTSVSTSSAAKHFKQCKFNEQQSNSVPEAMAFFSTLTLLSESCLSSPLAAVMSHCMSLHILSEWLFQNLLAWSLPGFQKHSVQSGY